MTIDCDMGITNKVLHLMTKLLSRRKSSAGNLSRSDHSSAFISPGSMDAAKVMDKIVRAFDER